MISILEARYSHVVERLQMCWGSAAEFNALYDDLFFDTRPVHRSGWPDEARAELQLLQKVHELAYESKTEGRVEDAGDELKWV
jgi:hypothetical protein